MITILEDQSPYYVRFTHSGADDIVSYCKNFKHLWDISRPLEGFTHHAFPSYIGRKILEKVPCQHALELNEDRVSLFITRPGMYYVPHKDSSSLRAGINYIIQVKDHQSTTSWYSDEQLASWPIDQEMYQNHISRENKEFSYQDKQKLTPLHSTVFKQGECVLFNTDIFHDFDNTHSTETRVILTIRSKVSNTLVFDDWKNILFNEKNIC